MGPVLKIYGSLLALTFSQIASPVSAQVPEPVSNSLADENARAFPSLKYVYVNESQTHDYSGNWDLDSDGIHDRICFIGTGGAHLYYFLQVTLSSDNRPQDFRFIQTDAPVLMEADTLLSGNAPMGFRVTDQKDGPPCIVVRLDRSTLAANRARFKRLNVNSDKVAIRFVKGKARIEGL